MGMARNCGHPLCGLRRQPLALLGLLLLVAGCGGGSGGGAPEAPAGSACTEIGRRLCGQDEADRPAVLVCVDTATAGAAPNLLWAVDVLCPCGCDPAGPQCRTGCATPDGQTGDGAGPDGTAGPDVMGGDTAGGDGAAGDAAGDTASGPPCDSHRVCGAPTYQCRRGHCVPGCRSDADCAPSGVCSIATGVCIDRCLIQEDCTEMGYHCDGGRCVPGCTFLGCDPNQSCDPQTGICAPGFCQWEVQFHSQFLYFGQEPQAGTGLALNLQVFQYVPAPVTITAVRLTDDTDPEFTLQDAPAPGTAVAAGETVQMLVVPEPQAGQGMFGRVVVDTPAATCGLGETVLLGEGAHPCLSADPPELDLGAVAFGTFERGEIRIVNACPVPVSAHWMGQLSTFSDWSVDPLPPREVIPTNGSITLKFTFVPTTVGVRNSRFFFVSDNKQNRVVSLMLRGIGVE